MADINKVIVGGRLTKDVELKMAGEENKVVNFTIASNRRVGKNAEHPEADFVECTAWNGLAEFISKYFSKGNKIYIVGRLQTRNWEDKDGNKRKTTEIVVDEAYFGESKGNVQANTVTQAAPMTDMEDDDDCPI